MKIVSWNVRGFGNCSTWAIVKDVIRTFNTDILLIQESKLNSIQDSIIKEVWGRGSVEWCSCNAVGSPWGVLIIWNSRLFTVREQCVVAFSLSVVLVDIASDVRWLVTSVHGPTDRRLRDSFWGELDSFQSNWSGPWCLGGDWNVVRFPSEKLGGRTMPTDMVGFLEWINKHSLIDPHLGGFNFNWCSQQLSPTMSHLDRFLLSSDWLELFPDACQYALLKPHL